WAQQEPSAFQKQFEGDWNVPDFTFKSGEKLASLRLHYITLGSPERDAAGHVRNAVLILHGTGGTGRNFLSAEFGGELFGKGQPLDASRYYIILPDAIGTGKSSKPSEGLRVKFPHYRYDDMVRAQYLLVRDGLKVDHLRLVMGTSQGGMHTWLWGTTYHDFMDSPMLEKIQAPLFAINSADDEINPPELGILDREIKRVKRGRYILIPLSDETRGHQSYSRAVLWKNHLLELLHISEPRGGPPAPRN